MPASPPPRSLLFELRGWRMRQALPPAEPVTNSFGGFDPSLANFADEDNPLSRWLGSRSNSAAPGPAGGLEPG